MNKPDNVIRIPTDIKEVFKHWFIFLKSFHNLTDKEIDVIACWLKNRYELSKVILDPELLDSITMNEDTKKKVREECGISQAYYQLIMGKFRKAKVIVDGKINPRFIPNIKQDAKSFSLLLYFDINDLSGDNK